MSRAPANPDSSPGRVPVALFANVECPHGDVRRALRDAVALARLAEALGYDQVWFTEHHFSAYSLSASVFTLLGHLAASTRRIGLGAAAVLLPFHDPLRVAEDAATVDALSDGRLMLAFARGGPFPQQTRYFMPPTGPGDAADAPDAHHRLLQGLDRFQALWRAAGEPGLAAHGDSAGAGPEPALHPRPTQARLPLWLASAEPALVARAARDGLGLMAGSAAPLARLQALRACERAWRLRLTGDPATDPAADAPGDAGTGACLAPAWAGAAPAWAGAAPGGQPVAPPPFLVARHLLCLPDGDRARHEALAYIRAFGARMGVQRAGGAAAPADAHGLLQPALVGTPAECLAQARTLLAALRPYGPVGLLLKPACDHPALARQSLRLFAEAVRPLLHTPRPVAPGPAPEDPRIRPGARSGDRPAPPPVPGPASDRPPLSAARSQRP